MDSNSLSAEDIVRGMQTQGVTLLQAYPLTPEQIELGLDVAKRHGLLTDHHPAQGTKEKSGHTVY